MRDRSKGQPDGSILLDNFRDDIRIQRRNAIIEDDEELITVEDDFSDRARHGRRSFIALFAAASSTSRTQSLNVAAPAA
ncbi:hypothetical protein AB395_00002990 [Sinorhizobium fredii CCBAU 45436]|nr:hypothetical protein AB395_00002990 [Sinorhizobium fredii CCBAU 45436]